MKYWKFTATGLLLLLMFLCGILVLQKAGYFSSSIQDDFTVQKVCASFGKVFNEHTHMLDLDSAAFLLQVNPVPPSEIQQPNVRNADLQRSKPASSTIPLRI